MRSTNPLLVVNQTEECARLWLRWDRHRAWAVDLDGGASVVLPAPVHGLRGVASMSAEAVVHRSATVELPPSGGVLVAQHTQAPDGIRRFSLSHEPATGLGRVCLVNQTATGLEARLTLLETPYAVDIALPPSTDYQLSLDTWDAELVVGGVTLAPIPLPRWEGRVVLGARPDGRGYQSNHFRSP
jgi:hypothetical protein